MNRRNHCRDQSRGGDCKDPHSSVAEHWPISTIYRCGLRLTFRLWSCGPMTNPFNENEVCMESEPLIQHPVPSYIHVEYEYAVKVDIKREHGILGADPRKKIDRCI